MQFAFSQLPPVIVLWLRRRPRKTSVVLRQIFFFQILVRGFVAADPFPPQLLDQPILMDPVVALHSSLRLRRTGGNDSNPQFLTHASELRDRDFSPLLL